MHRENKVPEISSLHIGTSARIESPWRNIPISVYRLQVRIDSCLHTGIVRNNGILCSEDNHKSLAIVTGTRAP